MAADGKNPLSVFTDGAAKGNPGPGGWGAVILDPGARVVELGGSDPGTTNNRMEMTAVIEALEYTGRAWPERPLQVFTDSSYVIDGATKWVASWRRRDWKKADGNPVLNRDLWERLSELVWARTKTPGLVWHRVRGHTGVAGNERADEIASESALGNEPALYDGPASGYGNDVAQMIDGGRDAARGTAARKPAAKSSRAKAYSYLSLVDGVPRRHRTWTECERLVKGRSGVRFKKATSAAEEKRILADWGAGEPRS